MIVKYQMGWFAMLEKKGRRFPIVAHKTETSSVLIINLFMLSLGLNVSENGPHT